MKLKHPAGREHVYEGVDTASVLYVNSVQVTHSVFDVRLTLGVTQDGAPDRVVTRVAALAYMSPQHAKAFCHLLTKHVQMYEQRFGAIQLEPALAGTVQ
jgi:uncharacterized protein DUF3467